MTPYDQSESRSIAARIKELQTRVAELEDFSRWACERIGYLQGMIEGGATPFSQALERLKVAMKSAPMGPEILDMLEGRSDPDIQSPEHAQNMKAIMDGWHLIQASANAHRRLRHDPKQAAKAEAFELWQERRAGKHPKLLTNEQFATECMHRWPVLTSSKVIVGWCTEWNKQAKWKSQPAS